MSVLPVETRFISSEPMNAYIETPISFLPVLKHLSAERIDEVLTRLVYEIDWEKKTKVAIHVIASVSSTQAKIIGYLPVASVALGALRMSEGVLKVGLAAASLGACSMLGLPQSDTFDSMVSSIHTMSQGVIEVMPLVVGSAMYIAQYAPSFDVLVVDLKVSQNKSGVITDFCQQAVQSAMADEKDKYAEYKPWAQTALHVIEKSYSFATEGAHCIVTYAAWGNIAVGVGALLASPATGGALLPYAITSFVKGLFALGATAAVELAQQYNLQERIIKVFSQDEPHVDGVVDNLHRELDKLRQESCFEGMYLEHIYQVLEANKI